ncbi:MAG: hypothetical protein FWF01_04015 [Alphaproteobacteria bacterium]|nr:hypothetical protein [Alphaproteobacteria bacterium]
MSDDGFAPTGKVVPKGEVFRIGSMGVGTILFGPMVAGYMLYRNHKIFGQDDMAKKAVFASVLVLAVLMPAAILVPGENTLAFFRLTPILYTVGAIWWMERFQKHDIEQHIENGGKQAGVLKILAAWGLGLAGAVIMAIAVSAILLAAGLVAMPL